ncbi:MAG: acetyl-CoA carboxylase carboxyltransferase subunit alpha [Armatimonadota bacterium]
MMKQSKWMSLGDSLDELDERIEELRQLVENGEKKYSEELENLEQKAEELAEEICSDLSAWDKVALARHEKRPQSSDYIEAIFDDFVELHGDRRFGDDHAIIAGLAFLDGRPVAVIGQEKGRTAAERKEHNFGMSRPEGYRKALRVMRFAAKMQRPIITLIDTPGADCLQDAESRGISEAIATNQREMFGLPTPVVCTVIGEGGSGGAIGIGVGDRLMMMQHGYYCVITPESCAAILWRDPSRREEAAEALRLTAEDARKLAVIDRIVTEPTGGAHRDHSRAAANLKTALIEELQALNDLSGDELMQKRYRKFRNMGAPEGYEVE